MNQKLKTFVKGKYLKVAKGLVDNPEALKYKFEKIGEKLNKERIKEALGAYLEDFRTLLRMVKAWATGDYREISRSSITYVVVCLVYFLTPTDFVPDFIIGVGFVDDLAVLKWTLTKIKEDVDAFKKWEQARE